jgi:peptide/nickel transport system ATP-binding protein
MSAPRHSQAPMSQRAVQGSPLGDAPLLEVQDLVKHYRLPRERLLAPAPLVRAVQGLSFTLGAGRSLGVVGESGSGKSTLARLVMALEAPTAGHVRLDGQDLHALAPAALRAAREKLQMVFQDPYGSLDPRRTILQTVSEPLRVLHGATPVEQRERAGEALDAVGLRAADLGKYPHEFSGGQRQRVAIARALITRPKLIVADEPVSALDVSVQAQVLNLMQDLQDRFGLALLFISHDLAVVDMVCDEVLVLYQGRVVEQGTPDLLFRQAAHPYTRALLQAVPRLRPGAQRVRRVAPAPIVTDARPLAAQGCAFAARCAFVQTRCLSEPPRLRGVSAPPQAAHAVACHRAEEVAAMPGDDRAADDGAAATMTQNA